MALDTKNLLSDLIKLGPDAYSNLYKIEMNMGGSSIEKNLSLISGRTTTFVAPQRDSSSRELPYQNINIHIPTSGTTLPRTLEMTMRIDSGYKSYELLRKLQLVNNNGYYKRDDSKKIIKMHVVSFESKNGELVPVYEWTFHNLFLIGLTRLNFGYEGSNGLTTNLSLIWEKYEEGAFQKSPETLDIRQNYIEISGR